MPSRLFSNPPDWRPLRHRIHRSVPLAAASWLLEAGSLTRRLRALCGSEFRVQVFRQHWDKPSLDEARCLGLAHGRLAVIREVALQRQGTNLVLARSVIPETTLQGADRRLAHLGTRPLGEILFADPRLQRTSLEIAEARLTPSGAASDGNELADTISIWGRRSLYTLGPTHKLLVAEFFLPALFDLERETR